MNKALWLLLVSLAACAPPSEAKGPPASVPWGPDAIHVQEVWPVHSRAWLAGQPHTVEPVVALGRPVEVVYEVENHGKRPQELRKAGFWRNHAVHVSVDRWGLQRSIMGGSDTAKHTPEGLKLAQRLDREGTKEPRTRWVLRPGQRVEVKRFDLARYAQMTQPGAYTLGLFYDDQTRFRAPFLKIWVLPEATLKLWRALEAKPLDKGLSKTVRKALEPLKMRLWWDPLQVRYRLAGASDGPAVSMVRPQEQRCKADAECVRVDLRCCCPDSRGAAHRSAAKRIQRRWQKHCGLSTCPAVACKRSPPGKSSCISGWCRPAG